MPSAASISILAPFQQELVGDWKNQDFRLDNQGIPVGGDENPLSYKPDLQYSHALRLKRPVGVSISRRTIPD